MLGSPFFPDKHCSYTMHEADDVSRTFSEPSRNNIWAGVVSLLSSSRAFAWSQNPEDPEKASKTGRASVRARVAVHRITLSVNKVTKPKNDVVIKVDKEEDSCSIQSILGIFTTELTAIVVALIVVLVWQSWLALLWLCPLILKLLSATMAVKREPLNLALPDLVSSFHKGFEVHMPSETGMFLFITGPPELVLQYFRHYGHPKRDRIRELVQLAIIAAFGGLFPLGLLCSVAWMPLPIQCVWLSYQMYVIGATYVARYTGVEHWACTEEKIAERLAETQSKGPQAIWYDEAVAMAVKAELETTVFGRYCSGRSYMDSLLKRNERPMMKDTKKPADILKQSHRSFGPTDCGSQG